MSCMIIIKIIIINYYDHNPLLQDRHLVCHEDQFDERKLWSYFDCCAGVFPSHHHRLPHHHYHQQDIQVLLFTKQEGWGPRA